MCQSVCYLQEQRIVITNFADNKAQLPVRTKTGAIKYFIWGRRKNEGGILPIGGWLNGEELQKDRWSHYFPKLVKIPVQKFMEIDIEKNDRWFDITKGQCLQGVYLQEQTEQRVYIVTLIPEIKNNAYLRWPRIILE